jgi:hypothetical protein
VNRTPGLKKLSKDKHSVSDIEKKFYNNDPRELLLCTFNPLSGDTIQRCNANQVIRVQQPLDGNISVFAETFCCGKIGFA